MTDRIHDVTEQWDARNEKKAAGDVKEAFVLPKNIRQMGQPGHRHKFYMEDYVYTYLHIFLKEKYQTDTLQAAVLLGRQEIIEDCCYTFICGAAACDFSVFYEGGEAQIQESIDRHFPGRQIAGWYVRCAGRDAHVQSVIKHYYAEHGEASSRSFVYEDDLEDAFEVYVWEQNALRLLEGFYIYYEKNPQMQEFLIWEKGGQAWEAPASDRRAEASEVLLEERVENPNIRGRQESLCAEPECEPAAELLVRERLSKQKKHSHRVLYAACAVVLLVAVATGVAQMGDYQNLKNFPGTIQTMSDGIFGRQESDVEEQSVEEEPVSDEKEQQKDAESLTVDKETGDVNAGETDSGANDFSKDTSEQGAKTNQEGNQQAEREQKVEENQRVERDQKVEEEQQAEALQKRYYTVKKGDSLLSISRALYKTDVMVDAICAENGISNVDVIYEGQKLRLP